MNAFWLSSLDRVAYRFLPYFFCACFGARLLMMNEDVANNMSWVGVMMIEDGMLITSAWCGYYVHITNARRSHRGGESAGVRAP